MPIQPPPPPVPPRQRPAPPQDDIVIRTMKDDLANLGSSKSVSSPTQAVASAVPSFPLPPAGAALAQKVVMNPSSAHSKKKWLLPVFIGVVVLILVGGGGWYALRSYIPGSNNSSKKSEVAAAATLLPKDASLIIGYSLRTPEDRQAIRSAWQQVKSLGSIGDLLAGNPLVLLEDQELKEAYFVVLSGDTRPFIIMPETPAITALLTSNSQAQVARKDGWVILHQVRTDTYIESLTTGTLATTNNSFLFSDGQPGAIRALMAGSFVDQVMRESNLKMTSFGLSSLRLVGQFSGNTIVWSGNVDGFTRPSTTPQFAEQRLLTALPTDVQAIYLNDDLVKSFTQAREAQIISSSTTADQAVNDLLKNLNGSYVYYVREGADKMRDFGLIIPIPSSLQTTLKLGDPTLEQGLQTLTPLITGRTLSTTVAFADAVYQGLPLRYVNVGDSSQAIDYAIIDGYIAVATSREGIFTLLDTLQGRSLPFETSVAWQALLSAWGNLPTATHFTFTSIRNPLLLQLLPHTPGISSLPVGFSLDASSQDGKVQAIVLGQ